MNDEQLEKEFNEECCKISIDMEGLWDWFQQKLKQARIDENEYWKGYVNQLGKFHDGVYEEEFLNRIKELKGAQWAN